VGVDTLQLGWQNVRVPAHGWTTTRRVMPNIYSVDIQTNWSWTGVPTKSTNVNTRRLSFQYAPNSTFATISHYLASYALALGGELNAPGLPDTPSSAIANMNSPQPVTSVFCQLNPIMNENDTRPIQFPDRYIVGCGDPEADPYCYLSNETQADQINLFYGLYNFTNISRADIWNQFKQDQQGRVIWIDDLPVSSPFNGTALGAIIIQPELCSDSPNQTYLSTSACVIGATWSNMTAFMQTQYQPDSSVSDGPIQTELSPTTFLAINWSSPRVKLSKAWAEGLNPVTSIQDRTVVDNLLRWTPPVSNICPPDGTYGDINGYTNADNPGPQTPSVLQRPFIQEALLASLVANGMSYPNVLPYTYETQSGSSFPWGMITNDSFIVPYVNRQRPGSSDSSFVEYYLTTAPGPVITIHGVLPGYAHGHSGVPVKIALGVLILYVLFASGFVLYTFITGRSDLTWSSIAELTALAINSSPTRALENTSAGISQVEMFRKTVSVREVEKHRRLELVFDQDSDSDLHRRVVVGRRY
jgi:hypothetical protein